VARPKKEIRREGGKTRDFEGGEGDADARRMQFKKYGDQYEALGGQGQAE